MVKHILLCLTVAMLSAPAQASLNDKRQHIEVTPGESSQQLAQRYPETMQSYQEFSANFCSVDTPNKKPFSITIKHGQQSIYLPHAMTFMGIDDIERNLGIDDIKVTFNLTASGSSIMHEDAKHMLFTMFRQLMANGWQALVLPYDPRLRGRESLINKLSGKNKPFNVDPRYEPTQAEWLKLETMELATLPQWSFYANNIYIYVYFQRNREQLNPNQPGDYLFAMKILTGDTYHRNKIHPEQREQWREHWPERALEMRKRRESAEADARRLGLPIDIRYQDPPPPPAMGNPPLPPAPRADQ